YHSRDAEHRATRRGESGDPDRYGQRGHGEYGERDLAAYDRGGGPDGSDERRDAEDQSHVEEVRTGDVADRDPGVAPSRGDTGDEELRRTRTETDDHDPHHDGADPHPACDPRGADDEVIGREGQQDKAGEGEQDGECHGR